MRRFISKLITFLSPIILLLGLVESKLRSIPNGYSTKRILLERNLGDAQVIITGSSHAYYGIKPQMLGAPAFSIAYVSQDFYYDSRILLRYLPQAHNAKLVVVPISYFSFASELEDSVEAWRAAYYYEFWGIPHISPKFRIEDYSLIALYGIPQTRKIFWEGLPSSMIEQMDESGGNARRWVTDTAAVMDCRATLARHNLAFNRNYVAQNEQYLAEAFDALRARDIRVVIITTPCCRSYSENMDPEIYRFMQNEIHELRQKYQLEYYNYLTDPRFNMDDFHDCDHLSTSGAEKFSKILKDEIVGRYLK